MGKFKKGVRVRLIEDHDGNAGAGMVGTIVGKDERGHRDVVFDDFTDGHDGRANDGSTNHWYVPKSKLEVVVDEPTTEEAWVPKVGDRVRLLEDNCGVADWGKAGEADTILSVSIDSADAYVDFDVSGKWHAQLHSMEPVAAEAQPAGLWAPVVGKYGKTRDGRKVGPIVSEPEWNDDYPFTGDGFEDYFNAIGQAQWYGNDLVAEWVDEPVEVVEVAPERKFKVGDVVNYVIDGEKQTSWQGVTITEDDGTLYSATCPIHGEGAFYEDWLELAESVAVAPATATPAKFKVGDRVVRVANNAPWAPIGYETVVQEGMTYTDINGESGVIMIEKDWALTTQPANDNSITLTLNIDSKPAADALRTIAAALTEAADKIAA